jgi:hypothetical protein
MAANTVGTKGAIDQPSPNHELCHCTDAVKQHFRYEDAMAKGLVGRKPLVSIESDADSGADSNGGGKVLDSYNEPGAPMDLDSFCDLVLYCHYHTRTLVDQSRYQGYAILPSIGP